MSKTIENLKKLKSFHNGSYGADIDEAIKAIEALEQEPSSDCISRQAAQNKIKRICNKYGLSYEDGERKPSTGGSAYALGHAFDDLPSVTPQQAKTKWIPIVIRPLTGEERKDYGVEIEFVYDCVLPEDGQDVLVTTPYGVRQTTFYTDYGCYFENYEDEGDVIAWCELPQPYAESEV